MADQRLVAAQLPKRRQLLQLLGEAAQRRHRAGQVGQDVVVGNRELVFPMGWHGAGTAAVTAGPTCCSLFGPKGY